MATVRHLGLFPWCVPRGIDGLIASLGPEYSYLADLEQGAGTLWPVAFTRDQALNLFWKVKSIRVTSPQEIVSEVGKVDATPQSETEKNLVCFANGEMQTYVRAYTEIPDSGIVQGSLSISWNFMFFDESIEQYWMPVNVDFTDDTLSPNGFGYSSYVENPGSGAEFGGNIEFFGSQLPMGFANANNCGINEDEACSQFVTGTIDVEEYWPYDPNDGGGPIYNSATGAQLRPFP